MEYLINFGNKSIVLSRSDIVHLYTQLEPYFVSIMQGLGDIQTQQLVSDYKQFKQSLAQKRENEKLTEEAKSAIIDKKVEKETQNSKKSAKIYKFSDKVKKSVDTTKMDSR